MTDATIQRIHKALAEIREMQARGDAPPGGDILQEDIVRVSELIGLPVSLRSVQRYEQQIIMRVASGLSRALTEQRAHLTRRPTTSQS